MDYFYYQIPVQREIKNFVLTLTIDRLPVSLLNYPDGVITPTEIKMFSSTTKYGLQLGGIAPTVGLRQAKSRTAAVYNGFPVSTLRVSRSLCASVL